MKTGEEYEAEVAHLIAKIKKDKALRWMYRRAWEMGGQGYTVSEIAREFSVCKSSVRLWMNQIRFEPRIRMEVLNEVSSSEGNKDVRDMSNDKQGSVQS